MRILVLAPEPFFVERGTPIAVRSLVETLGRDGHAVDLLTYRDGEDVDLPGVRHLRSAGVPGVRRVPPGFSLSKLISDVPFLWRAARLAGRKRYDLIHAVEESVFMALLLGRLTGVPYVYDMDSSLPEQLRSRLPLPGPAVGLLRSAEAAAVRGAVAVLTVCEHLESRAVELSGSARKVGRVEDHSLLGEENREVEDLASLTGSGPLVLYVGNLQPYQGVDLLVDAFAVALERVPEARLVVIGGSPADVRRRRRRAVERGIVERVHFLGPRPLDHLGGYLRQAAVLASPRVTGTNTPMKIYSYLASGVPIAATRLETHTQVLDDRIAVLAEPEPGPFGRALGRLLADGELRRRIGRRAAEVAEREYSREAFDRKVRAFYGRVAELLDER